MVTGRIVFVSPEYSPICSSVRLVLSSNSLFHWRAATMLVTRISVWVAAFSMTPIATTVLPAPQGSTMTPLPPAAFPAAQNESAAST